MGFAQFWPQYLHAHRRRSTRGAHYAGILFGASMTALAAATLDLWPLLIGIAGAFAITVGSHYVFEGRRPLLTAHPLLAAAADLRMFALAATGRLGAELARHGLATESEPIQATRRSRRMRAMMARLASCAAAGLAACAAAVLAGQAYHWLRAGDWPELPLDAVLQHCGIVLTEIGQTRWVDRIDEAILGLPLTMFLLTSATAAVILARRMKLARE
jgi:hypothetical protein